MKYFIYGLSKAEHFCMYLSTALKILCSAEILVMEHGLKVSPEFLTKIISVQLQQTNPGPNAYQRQRILKSQLATNYIALSSVCCQTMRQLSTMISENMVKRNEIFAFDRPINNMNMRSKFITINLRLSALFIQLVMEKLFQDR